MKAIILILIFETINICQTYAFVEDSIMYQGQASAWLNFNPRNDLPVWLGGRYIPQVNYEIIPAMERKIDFEFSANINGSFGLNPFDSINADGNIKPYRLWGRFSTNQLEIRIGLQKINFGSASMLRPLMWFDQVDPRDPLQLTDGVWGLLGRYYFLNNVNIWLWGLYGNDGPKTWEIGQTTRKTPEFGGRVQLPVPLGETALSFHHRKADLRDLDYPELEKVPENRYGFDGKWDLGVGLWLETSWIQKQRKAGQFTNQQIINFGTDYTFGIGNGINIIYEQLLYSFDEKAFAFKKNIFFSGTSISYPLGILDNLSAIIYYDWTKNNFYNFINWQHQFNRFTFYLMAFSNPETFQLPQQSEAGLLFSGQGLQLMIVFNH